MNAIDICKDAVELSFRLKKMGHDLFVDIQPHVEWLSVRLFLDGWSEDKEGCASARIYINEAVAVFEYNQFKNEVLDKILEGVKSETVRIKSRI